MGAPAFTSLLIGDSSTMTKLREKVERFAATDHTVLILGEVGSGKSLVAKEIHRKSGRAAKQFEVGDLGRIGRELVNSELFGHVRGAFTGALNAQPGLFGRADGGTLLLDEIGELPLEAQSVLLRVVQEKRITPLGGSERPVDVRLIAATNRDLKAMVERGEFRGDLYQRLNVCTILVPSLKEHLVDLPKLISCFALRRQISLQDSIVDRVSSRLLAIGYSGSVRDLESLVDLLEINKFKEIDEVIESHCRQLANGTRVDAGSVPQIPSVRPRVTTTRKAPSYPERPLEWHAARAIALLDAVDSASSVQTVATLGSLSVDIGYYGKSTIPSALQKTLDAWAMVPSTPFKSKEGRHEAVDYAHFVEMIKTCQEKLPFKLTIPRPALSQPPGASAPEPPVQTVSPGVGRWILARSFESHAGLRSCVEWAALELARGGSTVAVVAPGLERTGVGRSQTPASWRELDPSARSGRSRIRVSGAAIAGRVYEVTASPGETAIDALSLLGAAVGPSLGRIDHCFIECVGADETAGELPRGTPVAVVLLCFHASHVSATALDALKELSRLREEVLATGEPRRELVVLQHAKMRSHRDRASIQAQAEAFADAPWSAEVVILPELDGLHVLDAPEDLLRFEFRRALSRLCSLLKTGPGADLAGRISRALGRMDSERVVAILVAFIEGFERSPQASQDDLEAAVDAALLIGETALAVRLIRAVEESAPSPGAEELRRAGFLALSARVYARHVDELDRAGRVEERDREYLGFKRLMERSRKARAGGASVVLPGDCLLRALAELPQGNFGAVRAEVDAYVEAVGRLGGVSIAEQERVALTRLDDEHRAKRLLGEEALRRVVGALCCGLLHGHMSDATFRQLVELVEFPPMYRVTSVKMRDAQKVRLEEASASSWDAWVEDLRLEDPWRETGKLSVNSEGERYSTSLLEALKEPSFKGMRYLVTEESHPSVTLKRLRHYLKGEGLSPEQLERLQVRSRSRAKLAGVLAADAYHYQFSDDWRAPDSFAVARPWCLSTAISSNDWLIEPKEKWTSEFAAHFEEHWILAEPVSAEGRGS